MNDDDTVGTLLASIATTLLAALRVFALADKRQWGPDEHDQARALEGALDDAKRDFQEMGPLLNGQCYYENDRRPESLRELRSLRTKFERHAQNFQDWARSGSPIDPVWIRETAALRRELHREQCRAAGRIFNTEHENGARCLGAFLASRPPRPAEQPPQVRSPEPRGAPPGRGRHADQHPAKQADWAPLRQARRPAPPPRRPSLEALVPACNAVGSFRRLGERDAAFVCDYCDGFIVWEDLESMPTARTPAPPPPQQQQQQQQPRWQAQARTASGGDDKTVVFAPLAIANHAAPDDGDWAARLLCPYCDQYTYVDQGAGGEDELRYAQDERGFPTLRAFQEHLAWYHTPLQMPALPASASECVVM